MQGLKQVNFTPTNFLKMNNADFKKININAAFSEKIMLN